MADKKFRPALIALEDMPEHARNRLSPDEAADQFDDDPTCLVFSISNVAKAFGLTKKEIHEELRSGRLKASGKPMAEGGMTAIGIRGDHLVEWMDSTGRKLEE